VITRFWYTIGLTIDLTVVELFEVKKFGTWTGDNEVLVIG